MAEWTYSNHCLKFGYDIAVEPIAWCKVVRRLSRRIDNDNGAEAAVAPFVPREVEHLRNASLSSGSPATNSAEAIWTGL